MQLEPSPVEQSQFEFHFHPRRKMRHSAQHPVEAIYEELKSIKCVKWRCDRQCVNPPPAPPLPGAQPKRVLLKSKGMSSYKDQFLVCTAITDLYDRLFDEVY